MLVYSSLLFILSCARTYTSSAVVFLIIFFSPTAVKPPICKTNDDEWQAIRDRAHQLGNRYTGAETPTPKHSTKSNNNNMNVRRCKISNNGRHIFPTNFRERFSTKKHKKTVKKRELLASLYS